MPDQLVSVSDGHGHEYLATSADGRSLLTRATCADCCGECPTIRLYTRCNLAANLAPCVDQPDHVWLCEVARVNCSEFGTGYGIAYLNACYLPTEIVKPVASLPAGDVLVTGYSCTGGCVDGCTTCDLYYAAVPCGGQSNCELYFFPVGPGVEALRCPGFIGDGPAPGVPGCCYLIVKGQTYTLAQVRSQGGRIGFGASEVHCKPCLGDCQTVSLGPGTNVDCCCHPSYTATLRWSLHWRGESRINSDPGAGATFSTLDGSGAVSATIVNGQITYGVPSAQVAQASGNIVGGQDVTTFRSVEYIEVAWQTPCGSLAARNPVVSPFTINSYLRPCLSPLPTGGTGRCDRTGLTCNIDGITSRWSYVDPSGPTQVCVASVSLTIVPFGSCGGGCDGGCGPNGAPTPAPLLSPLPRDLWPPWAIAIAMLAKRKDVGVGDTVRRRIGDENSEAFAKWYKRITGKECGCKGRQAQWNAQYRY